MVKEESSYEEEEGVLRVYKGKEINDLDHDNPSVVLICK
jgi:hypothetical protein